jgi:hypothetical protein
MFVLDQKHVLYLARASLACCLYDCSEARAADKDAVSWALSASRAATRCLQAQVSGMQTTSMVGQVDGSSQGLAVKEQPLLSDVRSQTILHVGLCSSPHLKGTGPPVPSAPSPLDLPAAPNAACGPIPRSNALLPASAASALSCWFSVLQQQCPGSRGQGRVGN